MPETRYQGIDADIALEVNQWLSVTANYAYIDARYTKWPDPTYPATFGLVPNAHLDLSVNLTCPLPDPAF